MPPSLLVDLDRIDLSVVRLTQAEIYEHLPQRREFMLLDRVCHLDVEARVIVAYCDVKLEDWWVRGHIPGRPLLPGVLMLEMAGQASALLAKLLGDHDAFVGFGGVDRCKFRDTIVPPARVYVISVAMGLRHRRIICDSQGVSGGKLIFEAQITGVTMR